MLHASSVAFAMLSMSLARRSGIMARITTASRPVSFGRGEGQPGGWTRVRYLLPALLINTRVCLPTAMCRQYVLTVGGHGVSTTAGVGISLANRSMRNSVVCFLLTPCEPSENCSNSSYRRDRIDASRSRFSEDFQVALCRSRVEMHRATRCCWSLYLHCSGWPPRIFAIVPAYLSPARQVQGTAIV